MKLSRLAVMAAFSVAAGAALSHRAPEPVAALGQRIASLAVRPAPPRGLLLRVLDGVLQDRMLSVASGVAFYALLALAPSLAVAVSIFGLVADPHLLTDLYASLGNVMPAEAARLVTEEAERLAGQGTPALTAKLAVAFSLSFWSASASVRSLFDALNVIEGRQESRSFVQLYATALAVTLAGVLVFLLSLALIGANPKFVALGPLSQDTVWLYGQVRWPAFFVLAVLAIAALYRLGPCRAPATYLRLLPGAALAAWLWACGSWLFSWYVATLAHYTAAYGSLATVVVVMTWLWLSAAIVLLGAEFNHEVFAARKRKKAGNL